MQSGPQAIHNYGHLTINIMKGLLIRTIEIESEIMSFVWSTPRLQYPSLIQDCLNNLRLILDYFSVSTPSISFGYWNPGLI